jgi:hypothetical protein
MEHVESHYAEIGFGFPATGWKPDEIDECSVYRTAVTDTGYRHQQEGHLEGPPRAEEVPVLAAMGVNAPWRVVLPLGCDDLETWIPTKRPALQLFGCNLLEQHREVGQAEGTANARVGPEEAYTRVDAEETGVARL